MADAVILPKLGQTVEESTIVKWHKSEGDDVAKGDILFEIETDKAVLEVESFFEGKLLKVFAVDGDTLPVLSVVGYIGKDGEDVPDQPPAAVVPATPAPEVSEKKAAAPKVAVAPVASPVAKAAAPVVSAPVVAAPVRLKISPRAKKLAVSKCISPAGVTGTGPEGRIVVKDIVAYLDSYNYDDIKISPSAKKLAVNEEIDILTVKATGLGGRMVIEDVRRAVDEKPKTMTKMRKVISQRLTESFRDVPHFYVTVSVDMTDVLAFRQEVKSQGGEYSVTDFILEAVIMTLEEFKPVNSMTDGTTVTWSSSVDLGLAVGLDDGLVVPVISDSGNLSMQELHDTVKDLATRARSGKLMPDEMQGSTFTVSNMGMFGVDNFNAIINPGESAILAVASTIKTPVVKDDKVVVRDIMKLTLSVDHRIVDGTVGAMFVNAVKEKLEDIALWETLV